MLSARSLLCFLFFLLVGICLESALGASDAGGDDESLLGTANKAVQNLTNESSKRLRRTITNTGSLANRILAAVHSAGMMLNNEVGDLADRTGHFVGTTVPEHSTKVKDAVAGTGGAVLNHTTNQFQRVMSAGTSLVQAADDASETATQEVTKTIETIPIKGTIQTLGNVLQKGNEVGEGVIKTAGDMVVNPGQYASAGLQRMKSGVGYISSFMPWGKKDA